MVAVTGYPSHAQYRWHIVHSNHIDTDYYGIQAMSCHGENCSVLYEKWASINPSNLNEIFHSSNGGLTWDSISSGELPQRIITWNSTGNLPMYAIEQIDSVNAIAVGDADITIWTSDNWSTWRIDTLNFAPVIELGDDTQAIGFTGVNFVNLAEGALYDGGDGLDFFTVDSGKSWTKQTGDIYPSGPGMFRQYIPARNFYDPAPDPDTILTTYDNWNTADTATFSWNGPFLTESLARGTFMVGGGDTLFSLAYRHDSTGVNQIATLVRSTDLGKNWTELPVPRTNRMTWTIASPLDQQTIVIAGRDSTGEILISSDRGASWVLDTVPLDNGMPYWLITSVAVTGSGRVIASIVPDNLVLSSSFLAYLEKVPSSVSTPEISHETSTIFPNPATNEIKISSDDGSISISDPLGRSYEVKRNGNTLDVSALPAGVYFVSDGRGRAKFVKE